jgi:hypothetical protein
MVTSKKAVAKWNGNNMKTVAATVKIEIVEAFDQKCKAAELTRHAVLLEYIKAVALGEIELRKDK